MTPAAAGSGTHHRLCARAFGVVEGAQLASALDALVADIKANHRRSFALKAQVVRPFLAEVWIALEYRDVRAYSHDSLYWADLLPRPSRCVPFRMW